MNYRCIKLGSDFVDCFVSYINSIEGKIIGCSYVEGKYMFVYKANYEITKDDLIEYKEEQDERI